MDGLMQDRPLIVSALIDHAAAGHGGTPVISRGSDGTILRSTWAATATRAKRLAQALSRLGLAPGDRIGTLAWNTHQHVEIYFAAPGAGFVCHTINPRLFPDQVIHIVNAGADRVLFFDPSLAGLIARIAPACPGVEHWIAFRPPAEAPAGLPPLVDYEELLAGESAEFAWPDLDERRAALMCFTSGTTGLPKGVAYSHRSTVLHALGVSLPDGLAISARDVVAPVVSMFHVNAWGLPFAAALNGAALALPGPQLDPERLLAFLIETGATMSAGVPTIWLDILHYLDRTGLRPGRLERIAIGGTACPARLMTDFRERYGVEVLHAWGMTETSPIVTIARPKHRHAGLDAAALEPVLAAQGRPLPGQQLRIVGSDGAPVAQDGATAGDLQVRGWWVARSYLGGETGAWTDDGWFHTGDVATIDPDGFMRITDRSKDVIKSGGEWISSVELENAAMAHPAVALAAVIGIAHPRWDERPLLVAVLKPGHSLTLPEIRDFLADKVARWWLPDDLALVESMPLTATGKVSKRLLREHFAGRRLPGT